MDERVTPGPVTVEDDCQKGRWGGRSEAHGRRLRALFLGANGDHFDFSLVVESTDGSELEGPFYFHLHDSYEQSTYTISKVRRDTYAVFEEVNAYETFTAAVEVRDRRGRWRGLELDLEDVPSIPQRYKPPSFRLQRAGSSHRVKGRAHVLEGLISGNKIIKDPQRWRAQWERSERWVCRVRLGAKVLGTGVLVGRNLVLTNWHVLESAKDAPGAALAFEFDYLYGRGLERPQPFVRRGGAKWLLDWSPYTPAEGLGARAERLPDPDELDFALVGLDPAADPLGDGRGYAEPAPYVTYEKGDALIILQHPSGDPQCFAVDQQGVIGLNDNETRLEYRTNTEAGSSGSPCFDLDWQFVALHHAGSNHWPPGGRYNQGIPIAALQPRIAAALAAVG